MRPSREPASGRRGAGPRFDAALARRIDHTLLRPDAAEAEIARLCEEASAFGFCAVCVHPALAAFASKHLAGREVGLAVVVGFPHGAHTTGIKELEAARAVADGATEIDVMANLGWLRSGQIARAHAEMAAVVRAAAPAGVKVIIETGILSGEEKVIAATIARSVGAKFVKTSTGFGPSGATVADVRLLRRAVGPSLGIKASGGIRSRGQALRLVAAGADRLGTSASVAIVTASD